VRVTSPALAPVPDAARPPWAVGSPLRLLAAVLVSGSAVLLFAVHVRPLGYVPLVLGVALGLAVDRRLGRDLALVGTGMAIISTISLEADLSDAGMVRFAVVLSLPFYFIGSGAYLNWPEITGGQEIARLFVGVNAVGIWDELFFVCVVFALYREHFGLWTANLLQAAVFVSFLWELGYREWGPLLTVPFALVQGWIFSWSKSLTYVVAVHLLFDVVVFAVLVHAHHPELFDVFVTAPR